MWHWYVKYCSIRKSWLTHFPIIKCSNIKIHSENSRPWQFKEKEFKKKRVQDLRNQSHIPIQYLKNQPIVFLVNKKNQPIYVFICRGSKSTKSISLINKMDRVKSPFWHIRCVRVMYHHHERISLITCWKFLSSKYKLQ